MGATAHTRRPLTGQRWGPPTSPADVPKQRASITFSVGIVKCSIWLPNWRHAPGCCREHCLLHTALPASTPHNTNIDLGPCSANDNAKSALLYIQIYIYAIFASLISYFCSCFCLCLWQAVSYAHIKVVLTENQWLLKLDKYFSKTNEIQNILLTRIHTASIWTLNSFASCFLARISAVALCPEARHLIYW